jgi:hypothetical protein
VVTPAPTGPTFPIMFDKGEWSTTVKNPKVNIEKGADINLVDGGYTLNTATSWTNYEIRFDRINVSAYSKMVVEFTGGSGLGYMPGGVYSFDVGGDTGIKHNSNYGNLLNESTFVFEFNTFTGEEHDPNKVGFQKTTFDGVFFGFENSTIKIVKIYLE